jgi:hypothetical protein
MLYQFFIFLMPHASRLYAPFKDITLACHGLVRRGITGVCLKATTAGILTIFCVQRFLGEGVLITENKKNLNYKAMKNLTKTLFAAAMTAVVLTSSVFTTFAGEKEVTEVTPPSVSNFNRIWVSGNVKIILTQGDEQSVVSVENYNSSTTSVRTNGQTLYIKSTEPGLVTLNITVKDLQRVEAFGKSMVLTPKNMDVKYLQVFLHESAFAKIKTTAQSLYTVVKDDATLKLNGTADQSIMVARKMKNVKLGDFASLRSETYASEAIMKTDKTAMTLSK